MPLPLSNESAAELRQALADYADQGNKFQLPFYRGLLAEIEAEWGDATAALVGIDEALALAGETGEHWFDAGLHNIRGEILLKQNPADPAAAEAAFLAAIAVARQQKARSFELRAALSLAKLYQSTGRPSDAHDILGPALTGFAPTPEFPQIADAKVLFDTLAETEEVKVASASHRKRLQLQVAYGNALISARGYQAPETTEAFARARKLTAEIENASERFSVYYGLWAGSFVRGELAPMREVVQALLRISDTRPKSPEAGVAYRIDGETSWFAGNFEEARTRSNKPWQSSIRSATAIWRFVLAKTPALRRWRFRLLCFGRSARSIKRAALQRRWWRERLRADTSLLWSGRSACTHSLK
jgi:predicted ATPase